MFYNNMDILAPHEDAVAWDQRLYHVPSGKHGRSSESILFKTVHFDLKSRQPLCGNCIQLKEKKATTWGLWDHTPRWPKAVLMPSVLVRGLWANLLIYLIYFSLAFHPQPPWLQGTGSGDANEWFCSPGREGKLN